MAHKSLPAGATIGIIGGGQLGRMLAMAAYPLGYKIKIFEPEASCPASLVTSDTICANYNDETTLIEFAKSCDVVTFEFENVPLAAAEIVQMHCPFYPSSKSLALTQDRLIEKQFINKLELKTAPFFQVDDLQSLSRAAQEIGLPAILKTRRMGYDGKGQILISTQDELANAWREIGEAPAILEGLVKFTSETSMIIARGIDGEIAYYPNSQNIHSGGILRKSVVPAPLSAVQIKAAKEIAKSIADALEYIGVIAIELFVTDGGMVVNEIAPRVHNSGHWTIEGCKTSQFANHIRAISGLYLGDTALVADNIIMENLIGEEILGIHEKLADKNTHIHIYGKSAVKPNRKMGHLTRL